MIRYVIIGAGIAGTTAAEEIRKQDPEGSIALVGEEAHTLYSRVLLPHYIKGKVPREKCFLKKDEWYEEKKIEYWRGEVVSEIDTKNKHVVLSVSGRELPYDKLLITTGGQPRYIEDDLRGVSYLQTLDDADQLLQLLGEVAKKKEARAVVCGGGFIACEYLNIFQHFNLPTTCFHRGPWFWSRVLDEESGKLIEQTLQKHNVTVWPKTTLANIHGEHGVAEVETTNGLCQTDILGIGIGLGRDLRWIEKGGIDVAAGVLANSFLETNAKDVYVAGDVAEFDDVITGRKLVGGNWMNALMQGRTVAKTMVGERTEFRLVSSYATHVFDMDIMFVGDVRRGLADEIVVRGAAKDGYVVQLFLSKDRLVGATLVGGNADRMILTKLIEKQVDLSFFGEQLSDSSFSLKEIG